MEEEVKTKIGNSLSTHFWKQRPTPDKKEAKQLRAKNLKTVVVVDSNFSKTKVYLQYKDNEPKPKIG